MSVDERLHIGLSRNAQSFTPDVELLLQSALTKRRRVQRLRWAGAGAGLMTAACAAAFALSGGWGGDPTEGLVPADTPTPSAAWLGRYAGEVAAVSSTPSSVEGRWVLDFNATGVLTVTAPPAYPGVVSGAVYSIDGDELRTDLFSQDMCAGKPVGRYAMTGTGSVLALTAVDDPCEQRVAVLGLTSWAQVP